MSGMPGKRYPALVAHADWGSEPKKRWISFARLIGKSYRIAAPEPVGEMKSLLQRIIRRARGGQVVIGFDFPIGLPASYAQRVGVEGFLEILPDLGRGAWVDFFNIAEKPAQISLHRPFYPKRPGGTSHSQLTTALGVNSMADLLRKCECRSHSRGAASVLFWTLGSKQVGRAAIIGWRDMLIPALKDGDLDIAIWPFQGDMVDLLLDSSCIIVETYPAEACLHLGLTPPGITWSKRIQKDRVNSGRSLLTWASRRGVVLSADLDSAIHDGFGSSKDGEDPFDCVLGVMSMIEVLLGHRAAVVPKDQTIRRIEGWIFGQDI